MLAFFCLLSRQAQLDGSSGPTKRNMIIKPWRSVLVVHIFLVPAAGCLSTTTYSQSTATLPQVRTDAIQLEVTKESWPQFLESARTKALLYAESLPDFTCVQATRRFAGRTAEVSLPNGAVYLSGEGAGQQIPTGWEKGVKWTFQDEIVQEVIYVGHQEHYKLLRETRPPGIVPPAEPRQDLTSAGEFGSTLKSLFEPGTKADFRLEKNERIRGWKTMRAKVQVNTENSDREISFVGNSDEGRRPYSLKVGYQGHVWFDIASGQVVRLQLQALNLPVDFPIARSVWAIDYDLVGVGGRKYWLPVRAELQLTTSSCKALPPSARNLHTRNLMEFREFHKFEAEVKVLPE